VFKKALEKSSKTGVQLCFYKLCMVVLNSALVASIVEASFLAEFTFMVKPHAFLL